MYSRVNISPTTVTIQLPLVQGGSNSPRGPFSVFKLKTCFICDFYYFCLLPRLIWLCCKKKWLQEKAEDTVCSKVAGGRSFKSGLEWFGRKVDRLLFYSNLISKETSKAHWSGVSYLKQITKNSFPMRPQILFKFVPQQNQIGHMSPQLGEELIKREFRLPDGI